MNSVTEKEVERWKNQIYNGLGIPQKNYKKLSKNRATKKLRNQLSRFVGVHNWSVKLQWKFADYSRLFSKARELRKELRYRKVTSVDIISWKILRQLLQESIARIIFNK